MDMSCVEMVEEQEWGSVAQMTRDIDYVIIGRPISIEPRGIAAYYNGPSVTVAVDQVLKGGELTSRQPNVIQVVGAGQVALFDNSPPPSVPHVMFLRNVAEKGAGMQPGDEYLYYLPTTYQNVLADVDGQVVVPIAHQIAKWFGPNMFPLELQGMSFDKLIGQIRDAVGGGSRDAKKLVPRPIPGYFAC